MMTILLKLLVTAKVWLWRWTESYRRSSSFFLHCEEYRR